MPVDQGHACHPNALCFECFLAARRQKPAAHAASDGADSNPAGVLRGWALREALTKRQIDHRRSMLAYFERRELAARVTRFMRDTSGG